MATSQGRLIGWRGREVPLSAREYALLEALADPANEIFLSVASAWEIAIKHGLGELPLPTHPTVYVPDRMRRSGVAPLPITHAHALAVGLLPAHHRDPFDRLLIVQAQAEALELVAVDPVFADYEVPLRWAR